MKAVKEKSDRTKINTNSFFSKTSNQSHPFFQGKAIRTGEMTAHKFSNDIPQTDLLQTKQFTESSNGFKAFNCPEYTGDARLEACLNDQGWLKSGDKGASVEKVQRGLNSNLQENGIVLMDDGSFGPKTGQAVMFFKKKHNLGFENYPDVGPGTMGKLDELCATPGQKQPPDDFPPGGFPPQKFPPDDIPPCPVYVDPQTEEYAFAAGFSPTSDLSKNSCQLPPPRKKNPPGKKEPPKKKPPATVKTTCLNGECFSVFTESDGEQTKVVLNPRGKQAHDLYERLFSTANGSTNVSSEELLTGFVRPAIQQQVLQVVKTYIDKNKTSIIKSGDLADIIKALDVLKDGVNDAALADVFLKKDKIQGVPSERDLVLERIDGLIVLCKSQLKIAQSQNDPKASLRQRLIAIALSQVGTVFGDVPQGKDPEEGEDNVRIGYKRLIEYFATAFEDHAYLVPGHYKYENQKHKKAGIVWTGKCLDAENKEQTPVNGKCVGDLKRELKYSEDIQAEWCGIFVLWAFKSAGFSVGKWTAGTSIPQIAGFKKKLNKIKKEDVKPGDVGIMKSQDHHFIIVKVNENNPLITKPTLPAEPTLTTVDANTNSDDNNTGGQIFMHTTRPVSKVDAGFYRVNELL